MSGDLPGKGFFFARQEDLLRAGLTFAIGPERGQIRGTIHQLTSMAHAAAFIWRFPIASADGVTCLISCATAPQAGACITYKGHSKRNRNFCDLGEDPFKEMINPHDAVTSSFFDDASALAQTGSRVAGGSKKRNAC